MLSMTSMASSFATGQHYKNFRGDKSLILREHSESNFSNLSLLAALVKLRILWHGKTV